MLIVFACLLHMLTIQDKDGSVKPLALQAGDKVVYFKYGGDPMQVRLEGGGENS